jgi:two-component system, chemotaxis family, protein-glutamate methylesterase/glutaminase
MANRDILAVGTSAGGVQALVFLAQRFPADFPASVLITIHLPNYRRSLIDEILTSSGPLPASFATDGEELRKGRIYIAPPDTHLIVEANRLLLGNGPRENNSRPAIDPMLRSVALCCCGRSVGVVLTGTLGDGASGLWAVKQCGGATVVQDPDDAAFSEMPINALNRTKPDHVASLADMPALLDSLARQPAGEAGPLPITVKHEVEIAKTGHMHMDMDNIDDLGRRSFLVCPDCGGAMWEIDEGEVIRYRCHVGHAYTAEVMSLALDKGLWRALATARRVLEDRVALARKLLNQAQDEGHRLLAKSWADKEREFQGEMNVVREAMVRMERAARDAKRVKSEAE